MQYYGPLESLFLHWLIRACSLRRSHSDLERFLSHASAPRPAAFFIPAPRAVHPLRELLITVIDQPTRLARASGSISRPRAAVTDRSHEELTEAVVELVDLRQHAHGQSVQLHCRRVYSVHDSVATCTASDGLTPRLVTPEEERVKRALLVSIAIAAGAVSEGCVTPAPGAGEVKITRNPADVSACTAIGSIAADAMNDLDPVVAANRAVALNADVVLNTGDGGVAYRCDKKAGRRQ